MEIDANEGNESAIGRHSGRMIAKSLATGRVVVPTKQTRDQSAAYRFALRISELIMHTMVGDGKRMSVDGRGGNQTAVVGSPVDI